MTEHVCIALGKTKYIWVYLVAYMVKNLPAMQKTWVGSLGWGYSLEKGMATQSSILAWRIPWTEDPGGPRGHKEWDMTEPLTLSLSTVGCDQGKGGRVSY